MTTPPTDPRKPPGTTIRALLLDADGVVQQPAPGWRNAVAQLCGDPQRADDFLTEIFSAEQPCLTGMDDFRQQLERVLRRWGSSASINDALSIWTRIEPDPGVLAIVGKLSLTVGLATNQQQQRASFMTNELGYDKTFDALFYSCDLGARKPDPEYFYAVAARLDLPVEEILFIDDHLDNVTSARTVGLHAEHFHLDQGTQRLISVLEGYNIRGSRCGGSRNP